MLAFKISLSNFGKYMICNQFFIDEGFCSSSETNLEKVPNFFKSMIKKYTNIILVSHLSIIKNCADIVINISKSTNLLSKLTYSKNVFKSAILNDHININNNQCEFMILKENRYCRNKKKNGDYCSRHSKQI